MRYILAVSILALAGCASGNAMMNTGTGSNPDLTQYGIKQTVRTTVDLKTGKTNTVRTSERVAVDDGFYEAGKHAHER